MVETGGGRGKGEKAGVFRVVRFDGEPEWPPEVFSLMDT